LTHPQRSSLQTYYAMIDAANRQDSTRARELCSSRYRQTHDLKSAPEGGLVGLPRGISKNFKAWRQGPNVWLCPSDRVGPVYQFISENGAWRFDGPIGLLQSDGRVERMSEPAKQPEAVGP
jgi:hypothetical protein